MPTINQQTTLNISAERFVNACSDIELYELWLIMNSTGIQKRIEKIDAGVSPVEADTAVCALIKHEQLQSNKVNKKPFLKQETQL